MDAKSLSVSNAYSEALKRPVMRGGDDSGVASAASGSNFADMLKEVAGGVVETTQKVEAISIQAAAKEVELLDVITAVTNAELALESVVAVRDRVVQAYQDIIKMPI